MLMSSIHPTNWQVIYRSADGSYGERSRAELGALSYGMHAHEPHLSH